MSEKWIPKIFSTKIYSPGLLLHYPNGRNPLTWGYYKKNYACIPLVAICVVDYACMSLCSIYAFFRTDIVLTRNSPTQNDLVDLLIHPVNRKFLTYYQTYEPQPEMYKVTVNNFYRVQGCEL
nr:unnamed protein product [Callosobruchus chinensis]